MSKLKNQHWDFKNPIDRPTAERRARIGSLNPVAYSMACTLAGCSDEYRAYQLKSWMYQSAFNAVGARKLGFKSKAHFEADMEKRRQARRENAARVLCSAAFAGKAQAFRLLAECVEFIGQSGLVDRWLDEPAQAIHDYVFQRWVDSLAKDPTTKSEDFMRTVGRFNVEEFMNTTGTSHDRQTIVKRVRALGYSVNRGRPAGSKNKIKLVD